MSFSWYKKFQAYTLHLSTDLLKWLYGPEKFPRLSRNGLREIFNVNVLFLHASAADYKNSCNTKFSCDCSFLHFCTSTTGILIMYIVQVFK